MSYSEEASNEAAMLLAQAARRYIQAGVEEALRRKQKAAEAAWWSEDAWSESAERALKDAEWLAWAARSL